MGHTDADHEVNKSGNDNQVTNEGGPCFFVFQKGPRKDGSKAGANAPSEEEQSKSKCGAKALDVSSHEHQVHACEAATCDGFGAFDIAASCRKGEDSGSLPQPILIRIIVFFWPKNFCTVSTFY